MLDVVLIVLVLALTVATLLYGGACAVLMRGDSTRDTGLDDAETLSTPGGTGAGPRRESRRQSNGSS